MSAQFCNADGTWSKFGDCKVRINDEWRQCVNIYVYVNGAWKLVWSKGD